MRLARRSNFSEIQVSLNHGRSDFHIATYSGRYALKRNEEQIVSRWELIDVTGTSEEPTRNEQGARCGALAKATWVDARRQSLASFWL